MDNLLKVERLLTSNPFQEIKRHRSRQEKDTKNRAIAQRGTAIGATKIKALAIWDAVASTGTLLTRSVSEKNRLHSHSFVEMEMCGNIENVYHALSLNECRTDFLAVMYSHPLARQTLEQTWFPGYHSDVGGKGGRERGNCIPDLTLVWMIARLCEQKVSIDREKLEEKIANPQGTTQNHGSGLSLLYLLYSKGHANMTLS